MRKTLLLSSLFLITAHAQTLQESVKEVLTSNPAVLKSYYNYQSDRENITIAQAGYYPKLDLKAGIGRSDTEETFTPGTTTDTYDGDVRSAYLKLSQNLFEGFATSSSLDESRANTLASAYKYLEVTNDITMQTVNAYVEVLRNQELLATATKNVEINNEIFEKVGKLYTSGLTTLSEVHKIESSLALAKSNRVVQENNLADVLFNLERILGHALTPEQMTVPALADSQLPPTADAAKELAMRYNPSLLLSQYNIKQAQSRRDGAKAGYYPRLDLEVTNAYNETPIVTGTQKTEDLRAMVYLSYNLFNGFADRSAVQQNVSQLHREIQTKHDLERQVTQNMNLAWVSYTKQQEQLTHLREYQKYSEETLKLYVKEYDLGRRSLLDLLAAQNDFIASQSQIISTEYNLLLAKFRILNTIGTVVPSLMGDTEEIYAAVGLNSQTTLGDLTGKDE